MDEHRVIGVRDPHGFRPLVLGRLPDDGWVLASETAALDIVGAEYVRDVEPGEMVVLGEPGGPRSVRFAEGPRAPVRLRAHLLRAAGLVHAGPQPLRGPPAHG